MSFNVCHKNIMLQNLRIQISHYKILSIMLKNNSGLSMDVCIGSEFRFKLYGIISRINEHKQIIVHPNQTNPQKFLS